MGFLTPPGPPTIRDIEIHGGNAKPLPKRNLIVEWHAPTGPGSADIIGYTIMHEWFDPETAMDKPIKTGSKDVDFPTKRTELENPEHELNAKLNVFPARTVKISIVAKNSQGAGEKAFKQVSWDSTYKSPEGVRESLRALNGALQEGLDEFACKKERSDINLMVFGSQHHGKSSLLNHLKRVLQGKLDRPDELASAPPNMNSETTHCTKPITVPFKKDCESTNHNIILHDTPAFTNMNNMQDAVQTLLSRGVGGGTRRDEISKKATMWLNPPDAAIMVVSLMQWRADKDNIKKWMSHIQQEFKSNRKGGVEFPFCVVATMRDEFLEECQAERPLKALKDALQEIKGEANTDTVCAVANYKEDSMWSDETNKETYRFLCDIVSLAKNTDTAKGVAEQRNFVLMVGLCLGVVLLAGIASHIAAM